jgi:hypothetical protein
MRKLGDSGGDLDLNIQPQLESQSVQLNLKRQQATNLFKKTDEFLRQPQ